MHNKSLTVDSQLSFVGGRNIGDSYFDNGKEVTFADFDLMFYGQAISSISEQFDDYWNSELSVPITDITTAAHTEDASQFESRLNELMSTANISQYNSRLNQFDLASYFKNHQRKWYSAPARLLFDDPSKVLIDPDDVNSYMMANIRSLFARVEKDVLIVSPYFVPGPDGSTRLARLASKGVNVTIITNSLAATDVVAVHAGYRRYREPLLNHGVNLHEVRAGNGAKQKALASSRASLHAKLLIFDHRWVFVGSSNFDPRSIKLNTEMGLLIDSVDLARQIETRIQSKLVQKTYRLSISGDHNNQIRWHDDSSGAVSTQEPEASLLRRIAVSFFNLLSIEELL